MRKGFLIVLAVALVAALAAPAVAGTDINGFYRAKAYMSNYNGVPLVAAASPTDNTPNLQKDAPTSAYVDQRMRIQFKSGEENVKAVVQFEIDYSAWGDTAGAATTGGVSRNSGGALGADRINLETKSVYLWFKLPDTSLDFTVGMQTQSDTYAGLLYGAADMAGIFITGKMEPVSYKLGWAKLYENSQFRSDDLALYVAEVKLAPSKELKVGLNLNFIQDDTQKSSSATNLPYPTLSGDQNAKKIWTPGVDVAFITGPATISGFAFYQFGKVECYDPAGGEDTNIKGFALDLRADMNLGAGKGFFEALYVSGGDGEGNDYKSIVTLSDLNASPGGNSAYGRTDMELLLFNNDDINTSQSLVGTAAATTASSPSNGGRGITHFAAGYSMKLSDKMNAKGGIGYLMATKKLTVADVNRKGKTMGTELNANVNYNIMKGLDFGLYGAYAFVGDFYQFNVPGAKDPDDIYDVHFRLNYAF